MFDSKFFSEFSDSVAKMKRQINSIDVEIAKCVSDLEYLQSAPLHRDDVKEVIAAGLAKRREKGEKLLLKNFGILAGRPGAVLKGSDHLEDYSRIVSASEPDSVASNLSIECCLSALMGPELEKAAAKLLDRLDWTQSGPRMADRKRAIAEAESRLEELKRTQEEIRAKASEAGVLI